MQPQGPECATTRNPSFILLRVAAFLVDALAWVIVLIPPAGVLSYSFVWLGSPIGRIGMVWWIALGLFILAMIFRDAWRGRSIGKRLMALQIRTPGAAGWGWSRSLVRNLPLVIPGWNLVELIMVLFTADGRRTGDRLAGTRVVEE